MGNINLGTKIRELRRKKGITQEALASALFVTPQAVSKWESNLTYPDVCLIPVIAGYFEVSLDILFDFDLREMKNKIQKIIKDASEYFFSNTAQYIETIKSALIEYPGNENLTSALLDGYEFDLRENGNRNHLDEMIELASCIITESCDFVKVCSVKVVQAAAYLEKGEYEKAKVVLESLPADDIDLRYDEIAFRLHDRDKLNAAISARCSHLQLLYRACFEEGNAWLEMEEKKISLLDTPFDDYLKEAEAAFKKGLAVLTTFMLPCKGEGAYLWPGMQTFHWSFHQKIAACLKRMGDIDGCKCEIDEAYRVISVSWDDFELNKEKYMKIFNQYLVNLDLAEYVIN